MAEENNPSGGISATQTPPTPETGTASSGATPQPKPTLTLEEALKRVADLEHSHKNASEELERHRKNAKRFAELEKAETERQQSQLTEQEKLQAERDALQASNEDLAAIVMEMNVNADVARYAKKLNFILDDTPELLAQMLKWKEIEWDEEDGKPTNIEKLLEALAKAQPKLVREEQQTQQRGTPALPAMNPGRSSITQPGRNIPGRIPRIEELDIFNKR